MVYQVQGESSSLCWLIEGKQIFKGIYRLNTSILSDTYKYLIYYYQHIKRCIPAAFTPVTPSAEKTTYTMSQMKYDIA